MSSDSSRGSNVGVRMMPPDYFGALENPGVVDVLLLMLRFQLFVLIGMMMNVLFTVGFVWWLLFFCRFWGIPWIDGTTKGFVNRS